MKSILLVDKSREDADFVEETLMRYGFYVEVAETSIAAQRLTRDTEFDLILMDFFPFIADPCHRPLNMEQLGEDLGKSTGLIRELRARRVTSPIIVYTSLKGELYETASLDAGADDYIFKTDNYSVLLARLNAHLRRRQRDLGSAAGEDRRNRVGRFVIDKQTHILLSEGRPIQLTNKEVALLERLAANPDRIVSIAETLDHVWAEELGRSHAALEALIQRLRKKMKKHHLPNPIQTVRGQGLKLSPTLLPQSYCNQHGEKHRQRVPREVTQHSISTMTSKQV
jgi:DNA-binding response OmpR family regulator